MSSGSTSVSGVYTYTYTDSESGGSSSGSSASKTSSTSSASSSDNIFHSAESSSASSSSSSTASHSDHGKGLWDKVSAGKKGGKADNKRGPATAGIQLAWNNIVYDVKDNANKGAKKRILHGASGYAEPGTLTALIGPSGAGKTSLLRLLARKTPSSELTSGEVTVNGAVLNNDLWSRTTAFVAQDDVLMGSLTVREAFSFAAGLKLAKGATEEDRNKVVAQIVHDLGLDTCQDTIIGYTGAAAANSGMKRGISGGERKRVSIGLELLTQPQLLFLDEPTSGLDSYAAKSVMVHLKKLAAAGRTVVSTIHQPSSTIFQLFDRLIILAEGKTLYNGPAAAATTYFAGLGFRCPPMRNPADYMVKILFLGAGKEGLEAGQQQLEDMDVEQVGRLSAAYEKSPMKVEEVNPPPPPPAITAATVNRGPEGAGWVQQAMAVCGRSIKNTSREPLLFKARIGQAIFIGLISGLIYLRMKTTQGAILDRTGAIFFTTVMTAFSSMNGPMLVFPSERAVYFRESASGLYSTSAYFVGKILAETPVNMIVPALFSSCCYWLMNLNPSASAFFTFMLIQFVAVMVPYAMAMCITVTIKNQAAALQFQPAVMLPFMLLSGFYLNSKNIPIYLRWLEYLSFIKYAFRAAAINEFQGRTFICSPAELAFNNGICPITTGEQELQLLNFSTYSIWLDIATMAGMYGGYTLLSYIILRFSRKE